MSVGVILTQESLVTVVSSLLQLSDSEEEDGEVDAVKNSGKGTSKGGSKKYIPPRLVPVHYSTRDP